MKKRLVTMFMVLIGLLVIGGKVDASENAYSDAELDRMAEIAGPSGVYDPGMVSRANIWTQIQGQAHIRNIGWTNRVENAKEFTLGVTGRNLALEAIILNLNSTLYGGQFYYQVHTRNVGWLPEVAGTSDYAGIVGRALGIEAVRIRIVGDIGRYYDVYYKTHVQNQGWGGWSKNAGASGSIGKALNVEALTVLLVKK